MCDLYDVVQQQSIKLMKKHKDLDYNKLADDLYTALDEYAETPVGEWSDGLLPDGPDGQGDMYVTFTKKVLELPEKMVSGFGAEEYITKNHFMIQIFRIPLDHEPTLYNLLLIAMYTGFLTVILRVDDMPHGIVKAFQNLKMQNRINYVSSDAYQKAMDSLPQSMEKDVKTAMVASAK